MKILTVGSNFIEKQYLVRCGRINNAVPGGYGFGRGDNSCRGSGRGSGGRGNQIID